MSVLPVYAALQSIFAFFSIFFATRVSVFFSVFFPRTPTPKRGIDFFISHLRHPGFNDNCASNLKHWFSFPDVIRRRLVGRVFRPRMPFARLPRIKLKQLPRSCFRIFQWRRPTSFISFGFVCAFVDSNERNHLRWDRLDVEEIQIAPPKTRLKTTTNVEIRINTKVPGRACTVSFHFLLHFK